MMTSFMRVFQKLVSSK